MKKITLAIVALFIALATFGQSDVYQSAHFDGTNNVGFVYTNFNPSTITIEMWAKQSEYSTTAQTLSNCPEFGSSTNDQYNIYVMADTMYASYGSMLTKCYYPHDTNWHHIALVRDTTGHTIPVTPYWASYDTLILYVDGVYKSSEYGNISLYAGTKINIGYHNNDYNTSAINYYKGNLCKFAIYDTVLYKGSFVPDCVFDTLGFYDIASNNVSAPCIMLVPMNEGGTTTTLYGDHTYLLATTPCVYSYMTSPCAPIYAMYRSASNDTVEVTNHNKSYMKGANAPAHINGWDNTLGGTSHVCPMINYGTFKDMLVVDTNVTYTYVYKSGYDNNIIDTIVVINADSINRLAVGNVYTVNHISIFPNPSSKTVNIHTQDIVSITVYDMTGHIVYVSDKTKTVSIDLSHGIYICIVADMNNNKTATKILIE